MKEPKKVLIFSMAYYPKFVGGGEVAIKEITDRLNPEEYEFHLISLRFDKTLPKEEKIGNVHIYRLGFAGEMKESADSVRFPLHYNKYLYPFISVWYGLQLSKKHSFSATWALMANYSGFGALFFKFLKPKIPFMLNLQEGDPFPHYKKRVGILHPLFKMIFKKADAVAALSNYLAKWSKEMGFEGEPTVVPNGVDIKLFTQEISKEERLKIRQELRLGGEDVGLVTTSRLVIKNGVGDVIKTLPKLSQNIKFVVFGEGYLKEKLTKLTDELKVSDRVIWKGYVSHNEMPNYLKACDIFIRPSLSEGFGNSFIEAMAARLPVVATYVGGIPDFLFNGKTGYVCEPENPESIAETVREVINDPTRKNLIIEEAYNMVVQKYDWVLISSQIKQIFDKVAI